MPSAPSHVSAAEVDAALHAALGPLASLQVIDESHLHAGHAGAASGSHLRVRIAGPRLEGLSRVARHRLVYDALRDLIPRGIHALAIEAPGPAAPADTVRPTDPA